jgi:hypothetical protein
LPYIPALESGGTNGEPDDVNRLPADVPRIPYDISGLLIDVTDTSIVFAPATPGVPDMAAWEYSLDGGGFADTPRFYSLAPNSEHVVLIRKRETANYLPSDVVAILVRTLKAWSEGGAPSGGASSAPVVEDAGAGDTARGGILLKRSVVSDRAVFSVAVSGRSAANIVIFDNLGNAVFRRSGVRGGSEVAWNLKSDGGRAVTNGTYLIVAKVRDGKGKVQAYSAKLGVRR